MNLLLFAALLTLATVVQGVPLFSARPSVKRIVLGLFGFCAAALVAAQVYTVGGNTIEYSVANSGNRSNSVIINGVSTTICSHNPGGGAIGVMYADHYDCLDTGDPPVVVNGLIYVTLNLSSGLQEEVCWEGWRQAQRNYEAATGRAPIPLPPSGCGQILAYQVFNSAGQRLGQALTIGGPVIPGPVIHEFETWRLPLPTPGASTPTPTPAPQVTSGRTSVPTPVPNTSCPEPVRQLSDGGCACLGERVPCSAPPTATRTPTKEPSWTPTATPTMPPTATSTPSIQPTLTQPARPTATQTPVAPPPAATPAPVMTPTAAVPPTTTPTPAATTTPTTGTGAGSGCAGIAGGGLILAGIVARWNQLKAWAARTWAKVRGKS